MKKVFHSFLILMIVVALIVIAFKVFRDKSPAPTPENLLNLNKMIQDRDEIVALHKEYIKGLHSLKSKIAQIGDRIKDKISLARSFEKVAEQFQENKMWDLALQNYEIGLEIFPEDPSLNYNTGLVYANLGMTYFEKAKSYWDKAQVYYKTAISNNPNFSPPYYALGSLYLLAFEKNVYRNSLTAALENATLYLSRNAQDPQGYFLKGRILFHMGQKTLASEAYQTILGLTKEGTPIYQNALRNLKQLQND